MQFKYNLSNCPFKHYFNAQNLTTRFFQILSPMPIYARFWMIDIMTDKLLGEWVRRIAYLGELSRGVHRSNLLHCDAQLIVSRFGSREATPQNIVTREYAIHLHEHVPTLVRQQVGSIYCEIRRRLCPDGNI